MGLRWFYHSNMGKLTSFDQLKCVHSKTHPRSLIKVNNAKLQILRGGEYQKISEIVDSSGFESRFWSQFFPRTFSSRISKLSHIFKVLSTSHGSTIRTCNFNLMFTVISVMLRTWITFYSCFIYISSSSY